MMERKTYCTSQQKKKLVEMLESNKMLLSGKFTQSFTFKDAQKHWEEISAILNDIPGCTKNWKQWRKTWQDIRCKRKKKKVEMRRCCEVTGGGPSTDSLSITDNKILQLINPSTIDGDDNVMETNNKFELEEMAVPTSSAFEEAESNVCSNSVSESQVCSNTVSDNHVPSKRSPPKRKLRATVAQRRLMSSKESTLILADIAREKLNLKKEYYKKKVKLYERLVVAVENISKSLNNFVNK